MVKVSDEIIIFTCDQKLKKEFISIINKERYSSMSEYFREVMRNMVTKYNEKNNERLLEIKDAPD